MKKILILSLILTASMFQAQAINTLQPKAADYEIVKQVIQEPVEAAEVILENSNIQVLKFDKKLGIYNKVKKSYIIQPVLDSVEPLTDSNNEFIVRARNLVGYVNTETEVNFLTPYEKLSLFDNYIKVKKNGKVGLLDKNGNTLLMPIFQQVAIIHSGDTDYLSAKYDGEYKIFYNTGKLVPEDGLYVITYDGFSAFANDIRPIFITQKSDKNLFYEKAEYTENMTYEIQELKLPKKVKVSSEIKGIKPNKLQVKEDTITIDKKEYIIVKNDKLVGLNNIKNKKIIPPEYNSIDVIRPCKHFSSQVILAKKDNYYTIYDLKGNILAKQLPDKINIYMYGREYSYVFENGIWNLKLNKKLIGCLFITGNEQYEFIKSSLHIRSLHKINELLLAIISAK